MANIIASPTSTRTSSIDLGEPPLQVGYQTFISLSLQHTVMQHFHIPFFLFLFFAGICALPTPLAPG